MIVNNLLTHMNDAKAQGLLPRFAATEDYGSARFTRKDAPRVWVTHYDGIDRDHPEHYAIYRALQEIPVGRMPWTVDNCRVGKANELSKALELALAE